MKEEAAREKSFQDSVLAISSTILDDGISRRTVPVLLASI